VSVLCSDKTAECTAFWSFDEPTASGVCGTAIITVLSTVTNTSGACGKTYRATRIWRATDPCGNQVDCSQTVTVVDTTPPTITCVGPKTIECGTAWTFDAPSATDVCDPAPVITIIN